MSPSDILGEHRPCRLINSIVGFADQLLFCDKLAYDNSRTGNLFSVDGNVVSDVCKQRWRDEDTTGLWIWLSAEEKRGPFLPSLLDIVQYFKDPAKY
jgi:hypothetical protein